MRNFACSLFIFILFIACNQANTITYDVVIENGKIIDLESGTISTQTIFVLDGRISKIENTEHTKEIITKQRIDAKGKYVLPGFWDNHVHFRGGDSLIKANKAFLKLFIMNGITTVRDAGGDLTLAVNTWKKDIAEGRLIGPTIFTSGPKLDGEHATWAGSLAVESDDDIDVALDSLETLHVDYVKLYDSRISGEMYIKTIAEAEKRGLLTTGHMPFTVELNDALDSGIDAIEHLYYILKGCSLDERNITQAIINKEYGFWQSMEKLIDTYDKDTALRTFESLKAHNTFVVPTLHIGNVLSYLDADNHLDDTYLKLMDSTLIKTYQGRIDRALRASPKATADRKALNAFFKTLVKSLSDANVKLLAGSDSGAYNSYTYPGISLHKELEAISKTGISNLKALQTSAYNGADFFRKTEDYGTVDVGKISDLVILNRNPLEDINYTRNIYRVVKANEVYNPEVIAEELNCRDCIVTQ